MPLLTARTIRPGLPARVGCLLLVTGAAPGCNPEPAPEPPRARILGTPASRGDEGQSGRASHKFRRTPG